MKSSNDIVMTTLIAALVGLLPRVSVAQDIAESCVQCHRDALSLADRTPRALAAQIRAMRDGQVAHVVPIPALDDEEVETLAATLAGE